MPRAYTVFDTAIGTCGLAWNVPDDSGTAPSIAAFQLPEASPARTASRIARRAGTTRSSEPPPAIAALIARVRQHLKGISQDFRDVPVDLDDVAPFARQVYDAIRQIPAGRITTYGALAHALDQPTAAQAVGKALGKNPIPLLIPCHRILAARGKPGGFSAHGGWMTKARLLAIEGAQTGGLPLFETEGK